MSIDTFILLLNITRAIYRLMQYIFALVIHAKWSEKNVWLFNEHQVLHYLHLYNRIRISTYVALLLITVDVPFSYHRIQIKVCQDYFNTFLFKKSW